MKAIDGSASLDTPKTKVLTKASALATAGVVVEFYDFILFAYLAKVWEAEFFPAGNQVLSLIFIWSTFAVGMAMRPIGGVYFGWFGTKFGRRAALRLSIVLMSVPMVITALTPSYETIGLVAPLIFIAMRMVQGFSVGGEYSGSVVYLVEGAPENRRGMVSNSANGASGLGALIAAVVVLVMTQLLTTEQLQSWGWRLAYLVGGVMVVIAILMRRGLTESDYYEEAQAQDALPKQPLRDAVKHEWRRMLVAILITGYAVMSFFFSLSYLPSFLETLGARDSESALIIAIILSALFGFTAPWWGWLSDKYGRKKIMIAGAAGLMVLAYPVFSLLDQPSIVGVYLGSMVLLIPVMAYWGGFSPAVVEIFSAEHRFSAMGISYNLGAGIFGGTAGVLVTAFSGWTNNVIGPVIYLVPFSFVVLILCIRMKETAFEPLDHSIADR